MSVPVLACTRGPCGSWLASEGGGTSSIPLPDTPSSRASRAPTGSLCRSRYLHAPEDPVGAGLPAKAAAHSTYLGLTHRHREQARLLQGVCVSPGICMHPRTLWELACQRRRRHIQHPFAWHTVFASKPRSHRGFVSVPVFACTRGPCGSWLASEGGGTFNIPGSDPPPSRASSAPTVFASSTNTASTQKPVGARLARDEAGTVNIAVPALLSKKGRSVYRQSPAHCAPGGASGGGVTG